MIYTTRQFYTLDLVRAHPDKIFIFGDNTKRVGKGGQAIIRDEPNVAGVATKWAPSNDEPAFFTPNDPLALALVENDLFTIGDGLAAGNSYVLPLNDVHVPSLGLGLAELNRRAPDIFQRIIMFFGLQALQYGSMAL